MQIFRLLFAICTAPIKHLVYLPIFKIFCNFSNFLWDDCNTQVEIETKGMQFFGGRWGEQIRFILGDVQIHNFAQFVVHEWSLFCVLACARTRQALMGFCVTAAKLLY